MNKCKKKYICFSAAVPIMAIFIFGFKDYIVKATGYFPKCRFYKLTGYYCPACGNTRSVLCLLSLRIFKAMRYNITPVIVIVVGLLFYLEMVIKAFGGNLKLLPRNQKCWYSLLFAITVYYFVRNFFIK